MEEKGRCCEDVIIGRHGEPYCGCCTCKFMTIMRHINESFRKTGAQRTGTAYRSTSLTSQHTAAYVTGYGVCSLVCKVVFTFAQ